MCLKLSMCLIALLEPDQTRPINIFQDFVHDPCLIAFLHETLFMESLLTFL